VVDGEKRASETTTTTTAESTSSRSRRTFSWWRRTATRTNNDTDNTQQQQQLQQRPAKSAAVALSSSGGHRPRSPCRAAVVAPFSYRPSTSPSPAMYADLPESHQTKTAMLIERRQRRLKMASESSGEQTSSKPDASVMSARRKDLLVTTV